MKTLYKSRSEINGQGLFIKEGAKSGDTIAYIKGPIVVFRKFTPAISERMLNWIGVGRYSWINTNQSLFRYINHSCEPNVAQITARKVIAIKNITPNSEIFMDYSLTESEPGWEIDCHCGTKKCRHKIRQISTLPYKLIKQRQKWIPKKFLQIYQTDTGCKIL